MHFGIKNINKVFLSGVVGKDIEVKESKTGVKWSSVGIGNVARVKKQDGTYEDKTTWFNIPVFGKTLEQMAERVHKGDTLYIEGRLDMDERPDANGNKRHEMRLILLDFNIIESNKNSGSGSFRQNQNGNAVSASAQSGAYSASSFGGNGQSFSGNGQDAFGNGGGFTSGGFSSSGEDIPF